MQKLDVIIIGGGQAGLALGYYLKQSELSFIILDKGREVGEIWRTRYDSLTLFTPDLYSSLPGFSFTNAKTRYPTKDEVADYMKAYAMKNKLPIQHGTEVLRLRQVPDGFHLHTNRGEFYGNQVVVATGPFQKPFIPNFSQSLSNQVFQVHSSQYKNPAQLRKGSVLVVGGGNSGAQIAVELSADRDVYFSVGHKLKFLPVEIGSKSIFWYFEKLGLYNASKESKIGRFVKSKNDPIFGYELKPLIESGKVKLKSRTATVQDDSFQFEDGGELRVNNVIWSTGFKPNYRWIEVSHILDPSGFPVHNRGVTSAKGLYFLGLPWQHSRSSALIGGVGKDAEYLFNQITRKSKSLHPFISIS
ncbi:flavin-containing monooxygenase [Neobacillus sp. Marseille-QA0830]